MSLDRDELHAWIDGRLDGERLRRFERALEAADPARREEALAWRRQNEALRALGRSLLGDEVSARLAAVVRDHATAAAAGRAASAPVADDAGGPAAAETVQSASRADGEARGRFAVRYGDARAWLAAAAIAGLSASLGWLGHGWFDEPADGVTHRAQAPAFVRDAVAAHVVYVPEVRHPVEVAAAQHEHLVQWLSKRLGAPLTVPALDSVGWALVGGRLLPGPGGARGGPGGARAQFMYQDASGERLTLYLADAGESSRDTAFRFESVGPVAAFYWIDGRFGYTLSARTDRRTLLAIAEEVYRQLAPAAAPN